MPEIRETLDQLDQRLADLRHQLATLADTPSAPPPPPAREPRPLPLPEGLQHGGESAASGPPLLDPGLAHAAVQGVGQLGSHIEQLLTLRERLLDDARTVLDRYRGQLAALERLDTSEVQAALAALLSVPSTSPVQASGSGPASAASSSPSVAPSGRTPEDSPAPRPAFFQGTVTMTVTGATRIQTVQVLEDALSRIRRVDQVYIRRWHAGALWLELTVGDAVDLIGELNRVLPFPFGVQSATSQDIVISLEGER